MRHQSEQQVGIRRPRVPFTDRRVASIAQGITQHGDANKTHGTREITDAIDAHKWAQCPGGGREQATHRRWRVDHGGTLANHQICPTFEATCELRHDSWWIGEVPLQQQHGVTARVARVPRDVADQCIDCTSIAHRLGAAQHGHRHRLYVLLRDVGRFVTACVVIHHHFVLTRKLSEHRPEPPEQDADGGDLVVRGNSKVEHGSQRVQEEGSEYGAAATDARPSDR